MSNHFDSPEPQEPQQFAYAQFNAGDAPLSNLSQAMWAPETTFRTPTRSPERFDQLDFSNDSTQRPANVIELRPGDKIQEAIDRAPEGSVIRLGPGVYKEQIKISKDNITIEGDGKAIFDMAGKSVSEGVISIKNRNNVTISGIEIKNVSGGEDPTGIQISGRGDNISIIDCDIHHIKSDKNAHGINVVGNDNTAITNLLIDGNNLHHLELGSSEAMTINGNVKGFQVTDNKLYALNNIGIDIAGGYKVNQNSELDQARDGLVAGNIVQDIDSSTNPRYNGGLSAAGIYVDGGKGIIVENNQVQNAGYGIELASEKNGWNTENVVVRNNYLANNKLAGLSMGGADKSCGGVRGCLIELNTFANNGTNKTGSESEIWLQTNVTDNTFSRNRFQSQDDRRIYHGREKNPNNRFA